MKKLLRCIRIAMILFLITYFALCVVAFVVSWVAILAFGQMEASTYAFGSTLSLAYLGYTLLHS